MLLLIAEVVFVLVGLTGVWFIFWPAALVLGAVLGVVVCERTSAARPPLDLANVRPIRRGDAA